MNSKEQKLLDKAKSKNGLTFGQIIDEWAEKNIHEKISAQISHKEQIDNRYDDNLSWIFSTKSKGWIGNVVEEMIFDMERNNRPEPDFKADYDLDLELKTAPVFKLSNNKEHTYSNTERLVIDSVSYSDLKPDFYDSETYKKLKNMLVLMYDVSDVDKKKDGSQKIDYKVKDSFIWKYDEIPYDDQKQILEDYELFYESVVSGNADKIHENAYTILAPVPKGEKKDSNFVSQPNSDVKAQHRGLALKGSYARTMYRAVLEGKTINFTDKLSEETNKIAAYIRTLIGKNLVDIKPNISRLALNRNGNILKAILKEKLPDDYAFIKDNEIKVRTMILKSNGKVQEHLKFSTTSINPGDIVNELSFEESKFYKDINKPFIIVEIDECGDKDNFAIIRNVVILKDLINDENVRKDAEEVWKNAKKYFQIISRDPEQWDEHLDLLTGVSDHKNFHVRPNDRNNKNPYPGTKLTKQAFWVNNTLISKNK